jgi:hypothetical protein
VVPQQSKPAVIEFFPPINAKEATTGMEVLDQQTLDAPA